MSNKKQSLRAKGIDAKEVSASRMMHVPHTSLFVAPEDHPLFDERSLDPVDVDLAQDMADRVKRGDTPNTKPLLVQERKVEGRDVLLVVDGHGREQALRRACEILGADTLMPLVEFFVGTDKELLLERARRNDHNKHARVDSISTLAFRVRQLSAVGASDAEIAASCPSEVTVKVVEALHRFRELEESMQARFVSREVPIGLLPAVVDEAPEDRDALVEKLLAGGVKTQKGASRRVNGERAQAAAKSGKFTFTPKRAKVFAATILSRVGQREDKGPDDYRALGFAEALLACSGESDKLDLPPLVRNALESYAAEIGGSK